MTADNTTFFAGAPANQVAALVATLDRRRFPEGTIVLAEGDAPHEMYIIESGVVDIWINGSPRGPRLLARLGPGTTVGEMSLFTGQPVSATATVAAGGPLDVLVLGQADFDCLATTFPRLYRNLGAIMSERLAQTNRLKAEPERERIEQELQTAQRIQHTFLPREAPTLAGWELVPYYQPAHELGGDFYDFLPLDGGRLGLVIGDVTGKGIPAALVMTATHTMIRTVAREGASPGQIFARVNDLLYASIPSGMFVTCLCATLEPETGHLRFANAGHEPPFWCQAGRAAELRATGMPLGMMPGSRYEEHETILAPGECLLFYSDGLVEAHNASREMFGLPRLKALLEVDAAGAARGTVSAAALIGSLLDELRRFTGEGWEQEDDATLVILHRAP
jgi:serine phosphatase RsbU (regulator of sigma subunit)